MQCRNKKKKQSGFTLLEAIVALVIFASVGSALFSWLSVVLNSHHHSAAKINQLAQTQEAIKIIKSLNIMQQEKGQLRMENDTIYWASKLIEPIRKSTFNASGVGLYDVGLYNVNVWVKNSNNHKIVEFNMRQSGYKQVRKYSPL